MNSMSATALRLTAIDDQRNFDRVHSSIAGTLYVDSVPYPCMVLDISPGGARVTCGQSIALDTKARLYIDGFGSFEACVIRSEDEELGLLFAFRDAKRNRIIDKLAQFVESGTAAPRQARRHERAPANAFCYFTCSDGYLVQCYILDISLQGMSVKVLLRPPIGEIVSFGGVHGRVTRHHDQGVVVRFVKGQVEQPIVAPMHNGRSIEGLYLCPEL